MNLDFAKVCGKHSAVYEAYYKQIDPKGSGAIEAMTAAKFLKKSGLSDVVLSRVWDLSDPNGKGFLDKPGFFVSLKLVSLAQAGQVINMSNIYVESTNPPKVGDLPKVVPSRVTPLAGPGAVASGDWSISVIDRLKYEQLFESLKPVGGMLAGNTVKGVLLESKLPMEILGKIWDLADQDKDGNLDKHEFLVAMHLVYQTLQKRTVPDLLPPELRKPAGHGPPPKPAPPITTAPVRSATNMPRAPSGEGFGDGGFVANFPTDIAPPPAIPPLPVPPMTRIPPVGSSSAVQPLVATDSLIQIGGPPTVTDWVVTPSDLKRYEVMFRDSDRDKDGLVSGLEVKNVFLQSGVPQNCLAHIWALCDTNQSGKLTLEQFALAMWMVERKQKGIEPPQVMTVNMLPPSMRGIVSGVDMQPQIESKPAYTNPELEMISKEIEELAKERRTLETEIAQKEADIRIKSGESRSLQSELDTLSATLKQLENQRGEAQKRLDDLKAQDAELSAVLSNLHLDISQMRNQVNKIREQCQKQEDTINEQEGELNNKRSELQKLKDEETELQKEYEDNNRELQKLTNHLQNTQLQISSVRSMVTQLMEAQRQMTDALLMCRAAMENQDGELVSEYQLKIEPDFEDARKTLERKLEDASKPDPFADGISVNGGGNGGLKTASNGFGSNGFDSDPFVSANNSARGGFDDSFTAASGFDSGFDAFGSQNTFGQQQQKDPFGGSSAFGANRNVAVTPEPGKDDFGSDPFAALHAPTGQGQVLSPNAHKSGPPPRPESPSPALPPKKSKVPPPRPAPPRPNQAPPRPAQSAVDAFGAPATSGSGFADFADFDNKITPVTQTPSPLLKPAPQLPNDAAHTLSYSSLFSAVTAASTTALSNTNSSGINSLATPTSAVLVSSPAMAASPKTIEQTKLTHSSITTQSQGASNGGGAKQTLNMPIIRGPTDFAEDPFKDYRYEDPFSIQDLFDDADEAIDDIATASKVFPTDLSSDDDEQKAKAITSNLDTSNTSTTQTLSTAGSTSPFPTEFLAPFDAFGMNVSPVASQDSTQVTTRPLSSAAINNRSERNTPILLSGNTVGAVANIEHFADFDAFSSNSAPIVVTAPTVSDNSTVNNNDDFFDAFGANFGSNVRNNLKSSASAFDAFGETPQLASAFNDNGTSVNMASKADTADAVNDNTFEDNFAKAQQQVAAAATATTKDNKNFNLHSSNNNNGSHNKSIEKATANFATFDEFEESAEFMADFNTALNNSINVSAVTTAAAPKQSGFTKVQNQTTLYKTSNAEAAAATTGNGDKLRQKFNADDASPDSFEADLQEALRRSLMEQ